MLSLKDSLNALEEAAKKHPLYQIVLQTKGKIVKGKGSLNPEYLILGEASGKQENQSGVPFIGPSGKVLDLWLKKLDKPFCVINSVPMLPLDKDNNIRRPSDEEIDYFRPYVLSVIKSLNPKYIICAGKTAAQMMKKNFRLCEWDQEENYMVGYIYHPSYFMRNGKNGLEEFEKLLKNKFSDIPFRPISLKELLGVKTEKKDEIEELLNQLGAKRIDENSFELKGEKFFIDRHPFDHSNDIIIEESIVNQYDKFLLVKTGSDRVQIPGWTDKKTLLSTPPRDIYRIGKKHYMVVDVNLKKIEELTKKPLVLLDSFAINAQMAENIGNVEMISGLLAGLHHFCKQAKIFFKDINQKDECIIGDKKTKIYTRDALSDEDMLIYEDYYKNHPEIDLYINCKIKAGQYNYLGYVEKNLVDQTRLVQMIGQDTDTPSKHVRRIFAEQLKNLNGIIPAMIEEKKEEEKIELQQYVPLHVHSEYSIGDGTGRIPYLCDTLKKKGFKAAALTDHGTLAGLWEFQKNMLERNLKPILGCEIYLHLPNEEERYHSILLAKNEQGWKNLLLLHEKAVRENFYYKPIVKFEWLLQYHEGLIITSGCLSSPIPKKLGQGKTEEAENIIKQLRLTYGEDFYLELQPNNVLNNQEIMQKLLALGRKYGIKCIFSTDSHYPDKEDKEIHEAIKAIEYKKDYGKAGFGDDCFFLMQEKDIKEKLEKHARWMIPYLKELQENTIEIEQKCEYKITPPKENDTLPVFELPEYHLTDENIKKFIAYNSGEDKKITALTNQDKYLIESSFQGLKIIGMENNKEYQDRILLELNRIIGKEYTNYFLIMNDVSRYCREKNILYGPGRGSAGASLVAYSLQMTKIDPIKYELLFDRFISSIRKDYVDFDQDFQDDRRQEVYDYMTAKYGKEHCAKVITYARFHPKGLLRDLGRIFKIPGPEITKICSLVLERSTGDARSSLSVEDTFAEFSEAKKFEQKYPQLARIAKKLEGHVRHRGVHAAAIILTRKPTGQYAPLGKLNDEIVVEWEKQQCEDNHLIKFDILGLKTLTIIQECSTNAKCELPKTFDDPKVYETVFKKGNLCGIFQFEATGLGKYATALRCEDFRDLYDCTALFRPGPLHSGLAQLYADRKHGKEPIEYFHPTLEPITKDTRGIILYQEQIMQIMNQVGGMSWATAEMSRKVMTKSKGKDAMNKLRDEFVRNANSIHNIAIEEAEKLFDTVSTFGSYCLTGDTVIYRCSSNQYSDRELSIEKAFDYQHSTNFKHRKLKVLSMHSDGYIRYNTINKIYKTGKKQVCYLKTNTGKSIKSTQEHIFYGINGWQQLKDFKIGDLIMTSDLSLKKKIYGTGVGSGPWGQETPRNKKGFGKTNEEKNQKQKLLSRHDNKCQQCESRQFLELHHINESHEDNSDENTKLLCRKCHRAEDPPETYERFQAGYPTIYEKVEEIRIIGERETYDIEMTDEPRNFIANGFVSHNCFNKSHSVLYSQISYLTAWFKTYFPQHFYKAILKHEADAETIKVYIQDAKKNGISIEYPDVNDSEYSYSIKNDRILAGFGSIIGIGESAAKKILKGQPYKSVSDFRERCKISDKLLRGLVVADAFRCFGVNKKALMATFEEGLGAWVGGPKEDYNDIEWAQLIYQYTTLSPKLDIIKSFNFGNHPFINVSELGPEVGGDKVFLRGIITDVVNKDKLLRDDLKGHIHTFEKHMYYLNLYDGTGNVACQVGPATYEKYHNLIDHIERKPVIMYGGLSKDGVKMYADMIQIVGETKDIDEAFSDLTKQVIVSAQPAVSKNKKSYYRITLNDGIEGLSFQFDRKLFPGMKVLCSINQPPFMNLKILG